MTWADVPMSGFDTESTGIDPQTARIVTACVAVVGGGPSSTMTWLVNPGIEIPAEATAVHGVTTERARVQGLDPAVACQRILAELRWAWGAGRPVVIYNAPYDLTLLDRELRRHGGNGLGEVGPVIDPLVLDRLADPYRRGSRTLVAVCAHHRVRLDGAHDAAADALAAARVAWRIAHTHQRIGEMSLGQLMDAQRDGHAAWAEHYESWLRGQGGPRAGETVDRSWPVRPAAVPA